MVRWLVGCYALRVHRIIVDEKIMTENRSLVFRPNSAVFPSLSLTVESLQSYTTTTTQSRALFFFYPLSLSACLSQVSASLCNVNHTLMQARKPVAHSSRGHLEGRKNGGGSSGRVAAEKLYAHQHHLPQTRTHVFSLSLSLSLVSLPPLLILNPPS